jgi:protein-disulfide isomerase
MLNAKLAIGAALAGAFALGALAVGFSAAQPKGDAEETMSHAPKQKVTTSFSELQEEEIGELVRSYLMDNPEVIIDAVNKYSSEQQIAEVQQLLPLLLDPETAYVGGKNPDKAKIAVIELYDYHCGYCKRAAGLVKNLVKNDADVRIVLRELPILREESGYAAEMALAARDQGKFLDLHFDMLDASGVLTKERVDDMARKHGLDVAKMNAAIDSGAIADIIDGNHRLASQMRIDGTPAFIIASLDGSYLEMVNGFNEDAVKARIAEAKAAAR